MDTRQIQETLNANGFPCKVDGVAGANTAAAVKKFQQAYCGPHGYLDVDGIAGPKTQEALTFLPRLSTHFTWQEVACKHCRKAYVHRDLLSALEALRGALGQPLALASVYRCRSHNTAVGGKGSSYHLKGMAADFVTRVPFRTARNIRRFGGIGTRGTLASHVDVRPTSPDAPARWVY